MKKIILFTIIIIFLIFGKINLKYNLNMDINILSDGTAVVTETWDVQSLWGKEFCKNVDSIDIDGYYVSDYQVSMDGTPLNYGNFKKNNYRYKQISNQIYLCFTKNDIKRHTYTLKYNVTNYISSINNQQIFYKKLIEKNTFNNFSITIRSNNYKFDEFTDIKIFGFNGEININNGMINITNKEKNILNYVSVLVSFPSKTFNTTNTIRNFNNYSDFLNHANNDYNKSIKLRNYYYFSITFFLLVFIFFLFEKTIINKIIKIYNGYGYKDNKKIDYDNIKLYRHIPFKKDIFYAYTLIKLNNLEKEEPNILSAIILKWFNEKKIAVITTQKKVHYIDLTLNPTFKDEVEAKLFNMMYEASHNGILEFKEFHEWAKKYDIKLLSLFALIEDRVTSILKSDFHIYRRITRKECKYGYVMDEKIYQDSLKLYGLKKFLEEFSIIDTKEVMDVKLWEEYMMFACLFGIADKVSNQLKHLHPDLDKIDELDLL